MVKMWLLMMVFWNSSLLNYSGAWGDGLVSKVLLYNHMDLSADSPATT